MLKVANITLSQGRSYYQKENYYSKESEKEFSMWKGELAKQFGLHGKQVEYSEFDNILFGFSVDGSKQLASNSVDPKKYHEPEITKAEYGQLEFAVRKLSDNFKIDNSLYTKIQDTIDFYTRFGKKIALKDAKKCLTNIKQQLKDGNISHQDREQIMPVIERSISTVTRPTEPHNYNCGVSSRRIRPHIFSTKVSIRARSCPRQ